MAITLVGVSASNAFDFASPFDPAAGYPTGIQADDAVFMGVGVCHPTATLPTISGWTLVIDASLGGGTVGAATGPRRLGVYRKDVVDGTESGTGPSVTPTGSVDIVVTAIIVFRSATGVFDVVYETGEDTAAGGTAVAVAGSIIGETGGDMMVGWIVAPANSNLSSQTFTATSATYGTVVEDVDSGNAGGDDIRASWIHRPISSGTASAATNYTTGATGTLGVGFIRLRESSGADVEGAAALVGSGVLATVTQVDHRADAALVASGVLAAVADTAVPGTAALTGAATLAVTGLVQRNAAAALTGALALGADTSIERRGAAVLPGIGSIAATAGVTLHGDVSLAGTAAVAADTSIERRGAVAITGVAILAVAAEEGNVVNGAAILAGQTVFATLPTVERYGAAALLAQASLTGDPAIDRNAAAALGGLLQLVVPPTIERNATATLIGAGTLAATPSLTLGAAAALIGRLTLAAQGDSEPFVRNWTIAIPDLLIALLEPTGLVHQGYSEPFSYDSGVLHIWESQDRRQVVTAGTLVRHEFEYTIAIGYDDEGEEAAMQDGQRPISTLLDEKARLYIDTIRANQHSIEWDKLIPTYVPDFLSAFGLRGFAIRIGGYRLLNVEL